VPRRRPRQRLRPGNTLAAFRGGFRLWDVREIAPLPGNNAPSDLSVAAWKLA
jgi:hypothetical protein